MAGSCEYGNVLPGVIEGQVFPDQMSDCLLLDNESAL
jgi:hypothetical protein